MASGFSHSCVSVVLLPHVLQSLPEHLQNGNSGYSWKPEFVTGASSSLLHFLTPRKLVIKITHRLAFLAALPSVLMLVLDCHLKVDFFFELIWLEGKIKGWRGGKALKCHARRLLGGNLWASVVGALKSRGRSCSLHHLTDRGDALRYASHSNWNSKFQQD